jgi:trans-aconitate 2-methyltransferase
MPRDWDAPSYERMAAPVTAMGLDVLARLELRGDETVLDAGCGTGRVTEALLERLPEGRVIAVDGSPAMIEQARERLAGDRVDLLVADLAALELPEPVDAVLSTATFHWVPDHDRLFERLHAALKPGGQLVAQCGGAGNIESVRAAIARVAVHEPFAGPLGGWPGPWTFASPVETEARLARIGFDPVDCWRTEVPVTTEDEFEYFATVMLGSHLERLPEADRPAFVEAVLAELPSPVVVDYVRLNITARRA